jgi:alkanesulfonate monooxygenase SsuD/methylene tetrahydromethanopterin reductase-like flavin-dependent oxidoreductase (luciferase family)
MADRVNRYGLLLPHFGEHASRENLLEGARTAEAYGFDSVWVRDHLVFHPHGMEGQDRTHIDPLVTLSLVAAVTEKIVLGTGSLIPYRHPIQTAVLLGSLERIAGPGRVIAGFGMGTFDHEFEAIGLGGVPRHLLLEEQINVMRRLWTGDEVDYAGEFYSFKNVDIHPVPASPASIPIWYCGNARPSVRHAVDFCEGWMPGRITLKTFRKRAEYMREYANKQDKSPVTLAAIPITSPGPSREAALSKVNWQGMLEGGKGGRWELPDSGKWESPDDLEGALLAGTPDYIAGETQKYHEAGLTHLVYDLRFRFDDWLECVAILGEEVLPKLRSARPLVSQTT